MSGADWGDEGARTSKRGVPIWVWWGCGGGCLFTTLVLVALVVYASRIVREGMDPEKQWPRLGEVLAYDERPQDLELHLGLDIGADQFHLFDRQNGLRAVLIEYPSGADHEQLMQPDFELVLGFGRLIEPESGTLLVQGREVPCLRYTGVQPEPQDEGAGIRVDLTGEREKARTLELRAQGKERIADEEVEAFLARFDVWRAP